MKFSVPSRAPEIALCYADGVQATPDPASQQAAMVPSLTQSWNLDCTVIGLAWLEGPSLAIVQEQGTRTLIHLYNQQGAPHFCHPIHPSKQSGIASVP